MNNEVCYLGNLGCDWSSGFDSDFCHQMEQPPNVNHQDFVVPHWGVLQTLCFLTWRDCTRHQAALVDVVSQLNYGMYFCGKTDVNW